MEDVADNDWLEKTSEFKIHFIKRNLVVTCIYVFHFHIQPTLTKYVVAKSRSLCHKKTRMIYNLAH